MAIRDYVQPAVTDNTAGVMGNNIKMDKLTYPSHNLVHTKTLEVDNI
jgi:hypothetical protein